VEVPEIDVDELAQRREQGTLVVDVRQPDEYEEGHVPGARSIPLGEVASRVDEVPTDAPVLLICGSGGRSLKAAEFLRARGRDATNVAGGTLAWIESGRSVVRGGEPEPST
jgi:rhodanese-related sulfurtransferase